VAVVGVAEVVLAAEVAEVAEVGAKAQ